MRITQKYINELSYKIIGLAIVVHKHLGPGLLESVYHICCENISKNIISMVTEEYAKLPND
jgi:GxxExxY protein